MIDPIVDPFVRWCGGKRRMLPTLLPILNRALEARTDPVYVEPFLGGGAVALNLDPKYSKILSDLCEPLVAAWTGVQLWPGVLAIQLQRMEHDCTAAAYYQTRGNFNARLRSRRGSVQTIAAEFLYLNRLCWNGVWRTNRAGLLNVPYGGRAKSMLSVDQLRAASDRIPKVVSFDRLGTWIVPRGIGTHIAVESGTDLLGGLLGSTRPLVIYADPPYDETFDGYHGDGFDGDDQKDLADVLRALAEEGHAIIATNADTPRVRDLYAWAEITPVLEERRVSSDGDRTPASCLLLTRNCT